MNSHFLYQNRESKLSVVLATPNAFRYIALTLAHFRANTARLNRTGSGGRINRKISDSRRCGRWFRVGLVGAMQQKSDSGRSACEWCATFARVFGGVCGRSGVSQTRMGAGHDRRASRFRCGKPGCKCSCITGVCSIRRATRIGVKEKVVLCAGFATDSLRALVEIAARQRRQGFIEYSYSDLHWACGR